MKDLIQEGRKIQETFKKNVVSETFFPKTKEEVERILKELGVTNYTIRPDLSVDCGKNVYLGGKKLTKIPVKFYSAVYFDCSGNELTSLEGAPKFVNKHFNCSDNKLTSLEGAPQRVGGNFICVNNNPPIPESQKDWAEKNIKARGFNW